MGATDPALRNIQYPVWWLCSVLCRHESATGPSHWPPTADTTSQRQPSVQSGTDRSIVTADDVTYIGLRVC